MKRAYKTNLRCGGCVQTIAPLLDGDSSIASWNANVESPDRLLTVEGDLVSRSQVESLLGKAGYQVLEEVTVAEPLASLPAPAEKTSLFPLLLIVGYILGVVFLVELGSGSFDGPRATTNFMAGFFLVFSFFKLLDLQNGLFSIPDDPEIDGVDAHGDGVLRQRRFGLDVADSHALVNGGADRVNDRNDPKHSRSAHANETSEAEKRDALPLIGNTDGEEQIDANQRKYKYGPWGPREQRARAADEEAAGE